MLYGQTQCYYNVMEEAEEEKKKEIKRRSRKRSVFEIAGLPDSYGMSIKLFVLSLAILSIVLRCKELR